MAWTLAFVGAVLQGYGPPFVLAVYWLRRFPELQILSLFTTLVGFFALYPMAILYQAGIKDSAPAVYALLGSLVKESSRLGVCWLVLAMEQVFRGHTQVLHNSRFRLVMLGAGVGFGLGAAQLLLIFGTTLEAYNRVSGGDGVEMYNLGACTSMPFTLFLAVQSNLAVVFEVCGTMVTMPAVAGIRGMGPGARRSTVRTSLVSASGHQGNECAGGRYSGGDHDSSNQPQAAASTTTRNNKMKEAPRVGRQPGGGKVLPSIPPKRATTFGRAGGVLLVAIVIILHLLFSGLSLLNSGSVNWEDSSQYVSGRGCQVSIPVQAIVVIGLVGLSVMVAVREVVSVSEEGAGGSDSRVVGGIDSQYHGELESQVLVHRGGGEERRSDAASIVSAAAASRDGWRPQQL